MQPFDRSGGQALFARAYTGHPDEIRTAKEQRYFAVVERPAVLCSCFLA